MLTSRMTDRPGTTLPAAAVLARNNVRVSGRPDGRPLVFVHGFACDQRMWRLIAPAFEDAHRVVLLDQVGAGRSDPTAYDVARYSTLDGYARDLVEIADALDLRDAVVIGHSVGALVGVLAHLAAPERISGLVLVGASARYVDEPETGYVGGLAAAEVEDLLRTLEANFIGWSTAMAPAVMGNPERPQLGEELTEQFCRTDPDIAARWARVTFLADVRDALPRITARTLVLRCSEDPIVPDAAGRWFAEHVPGGASVLLDATGHCPHLSAPEATRGAIEAFLAGG